MEVFMGSLIINLIAGALGGNLAGKVFKDLSLGTVGNSIAGILGGGLGGWLLGLLGLSTTGDASMSLSSFIGDTIGGGVGGGVLLAIVGAIKKAMGTKS
jgi:uncharacterized membrane protein YeaQ/YmgE (transglycosylase-associated protein family)